MEAAGYSGTPLAKKLGIKPGFKVALVNAPLYYPDLFTDLPADVVFTSGASGLNNLIHLFVKDKAQYFALLTGLKTHIVQNGIIWVSWPKKVSKIITDINEDIIRIYALESGLVDIKVCAVNEVWSGLKLVIRVKDRK